jgi:hypothetical protein
MWIYSRWKHPLSIKHYHISNHKLSMRLSATTFMIIFTHISKDLEHQQSSSPYKTLNSIKNLNTSGVKHLTENAIFPFLQNQVFYFPVATT